MAFTLKKPAPIPAKPAPVAPAPTILGSVKAPDLQIIRKGASFRVGDRVHIGENFRVGGGDPASLGFTPFEVRKPKHFMLVIGGVDGTGKTALALTAAAMGRPVYLLSLSEKTSGDKHMQKLCSRGNVFIKRFSTKEENPLQSEAIAKRTYNDVLRTLYALYGVDGVVIIDNVTELYEIGRMAIYGRIEKVPQRDYGAINSDMKSWTHLYAEGDAPTDSILISRVAPVYVGGEATSAVDFRGHKEAVYQCDMAIVMKKAIRTAEGRVNPVDKKFIAEVMRCKTRNIIEGKEYQGPAELNFEALKREALSEI